MAVPEAKVLFLSGVCGKYDVAFRTAARLHDKAGPFAAVFFVGDFLAEPDPALGLQPYISGEKTISVPCYFCADPNIASEKLQAVVGHNLCPNLHFLGNCGLFELHGLEVAVFAPNAAGTSPTPQSQQTLLSQFFGRSTAPEKLRRPGVDLLITNKWPTRLLEHLSDADRPAKNARADQPPGACMKTQHVAQVLTPRYHICTSDFFYERPPYAQPPASHAIRFIALAPLNNPEKEKHMYALKLAPLVSAPDTAILVHPANETPCPYQPPPRKQPAAPLLDAPEAKRMRTGGPVSRGRAPPQQQLQRKECWFCLSSVHVEKHLIVAIGDEAYIALPKGSLTPDHALIIPIAHVPALSHCPPTSPLAVEIKKFKSALVQMCAKQQRGIIFVDRNAPTRNDVMKHAHLQVMPVPLNLMAGAKGTFIAEGKQLDIVFEDVGEQADISQLVREDECYLSVEISGHGRLLTRIKDTHHPLQFNRQVVANILGTPSRGNWKTCTCTPKEEEALTAQFKALFAPFDFTADEDE